MKHSLSRFNPLPSPKQGETYPLGWPLDAHTGFNPLPSPKQGETFPETATATSLWTFQSAPLTEARGDSPVLRA